MQRLLSIVVLIGVLIYAFPAAAQQITYTDNYKFPLIPRGYKQYWDIQYNAAMNTLEVMFTRTAFIDTQNTFTQKQIVNNSMDVLYNLVVGGNINTTGSVTIDGSLTTSGLFHSIGPLQVDGDFTAGSSAYFGNDASFTNKISVIDSDTLEISFIGGVFGIEVFGAGARSILSSASSGDLETEGHKIWHESNDGASSGLDADMVDGKHASELLGGEIEGNLGVPEQTPTQFYRFDFASTTGAVRFDVNVIASLEDGSSSSSGEWFFIASKMSDGTILISDLQTKDNFDGLTANAALAKLDSISFNYSLFGGSLIDFNVTGVTSGTLDPNKFYINYKIKKNKL